MSKVQTIIPPALVWYEIIRDFKTELRRQRQRINVNGKMHLLCFSKLHRDYFNRFLENSLKIFLKNPVTKIHKASNCEVKRRSRALSIFPRRSELLLLAFVKFKGRNNVFDFIYFYFSSCLSRYLTYNLLRSVPDMTGLSDIRM